MSTVNHGLRSLTETEANKVWDILVEHAGASESERDGFVAYLASDVHYGHEYRFQGIFGFGGKLHYYRGSPPYVDSYPEDFTETRRIAAAKINALLRREVA
jgi:hypothetical protein